jgi:hypothetical protein
MKTLDDKYHAAKRAYDDAIKNHGKRSIMAGVALRELRDMTNRIFKRDNRKRKRKAA